MTRRIDFGDLAGREIPSGCNECDAHQTMTEMSPGIWFLTVHHDDWCPFMRARVAEAN